MLIFLILVFCSFLIIAYNHREHNLFRGTPTERRLVRKLKRIGFTSESIYHDLYLKLNRGDYFSQIDLVLLTDVGIVVIEVKKITGRIYGNIDQDYWTQVLAYGRYKYKLYNPLKQNKSHVIHLKRILNEPNVPFFSLIVFYGNNTIENINNVPENVALISNNYIPNYIQLLINSNPRIEYRDKANIINVLNQAVLNGENKEIRELHKRNIRNRYN